MIYFDNGATSFPKPRAVAKAVMEGFKTYGANPGRSGHDMALETAKKVYDVREKVSLMFGASSPEEVVFTPNCTFSVNIALKGLLRRGDHVIISDLEHNAVLRPIHKMREDGVISYSIAETHIDRKKTVDSFEGLISRETRLIACAHASNAFGIRLPIEELGALCRDKDILFLVDAAQTAGTLPLDACKFGIDFLCASGHKSLLGSSGTGILITPLGSLLDTIIEGGTGSFSASYEQPMEIPDRLESGTLNTPGILGLGAGIDWISEKGREALYRHEMKLAAEIFRQLSAISGVKLYTPDFAEGTHLPVISFNIGGKSSDDTTLLLNREGFALRGGLQCAPLAHKKMGTIEHGAARISIGAFNTESQAEALCDAIKKISLI